LELPSEDVRLDRKIETMPLPEGGEAIRDGRRGEQLASGL
jgi:hypothetical protein